MSAIVTKKFRVHAAEQLKEAFTEPANNKMYIAIGRSRPWTSDVSPPSPLERPQETEYDFWKDMLAAKRVQPTDVAHVVPRYDWTANTVYSQYDHTSATFQSNTSRPFYVLTSDFNIYKCLFNNGNANSTVEPSGTGNTVITTGDSYKWKYMCSISAADALKFVTPDYMPVSNNSSVKASAVDGAIDVILVTSGGASYSSAPTVTITGDGTGATANATIAANAVSTINIITRGTGYSNAVITLSGGNTTSTVATARAIIGPKNGHGHNVLEELGAYYVMFNAQLTAAESNNFTVSNDFRQIGLLKDPQVFGSNTIATATTYRQTYRYTIGSASGNFTVDEVVTSNTSGVTARVVEWDSVNNLLFVNYQANNAIANGELLTGTSSSVTGVISAISTPGLKPYSGDTLYVENRTPISRASDQTEDVKLIIQT